MYETQLLLFKGGTILKTQSLYQVCVSGQRVRSPALFAATILLSVLVIGPNAYALSCGDIITTTTTLTANLGPCDGVALTVGASNIRLNLNGWSIIGFFKSLPDCTEVVTPCLEGVNVGGTTNVTINGPGTITGFSFGVSVFDVTGHRTGSSGTTVRHVHFVANSAIGIAFVVGAGNRILNNTFSANPCIAIKIDAVAGARIIGNAISGSNAPPASNTCGMQQSATGGGLGIGIVSTSTGAMVKHNSVNNSTNGIFVDSSSSPITVRANDFSGNTQDGIAMESQATLTGNQANGNGRDGISVAFGSLSRIQFNTANSNGHNGIGLGDLLGASGNNNTISSNRALGNGSNSVFAPSFDLFWDGNGTGNTWLTNFCDTRTMNIGGPPCL